MSDEANLTPESTPDTAPDSAPQQSTEPDRDWKSEAEKWKSLARKHEDNAKANVAKAKQFDEISESQKSELQKILDRAEKAEKRALELEFTSMRAEVAANTGVPASLLTGSSREELEANAKALLAFKGTQKPDFGGGNRGDDHGGKVKQLTRDDMRRMTPEAIVQAQAKGQFADLLKHS